LKDYIIIIVVFIALLLTTPPLFKAVNPNPASLESGGEAYHFPRSITLHLIESEDIIRLSVEDYLVGCLFAQIPVTFHEQALRAQAVAAHTYLLRLLEDNTVITDDSATCQPFFTEDRAKEHYGARYDEYLEKVRAAARFGASRAVFYKNEPIHAVYHSVSAGVTNTAFSIWGRDLPYLQSVESSWDREHPDFMVINEITAETIRLTLFDYNKTASMPVDYEMWFVNPVKNEFGYVLSLRLGEVLLSGGDMWRLFNLRSPSFEVSYRRDGIFTIETRGFGHGAGLSQYGADVLGRRGFSAEDILLHYYTDVNIVLA